MSDPETELILTLIKVIKRLQNAERKIGRLEEKLKQSKNNNGRKKWEEWARRIIQWLVAAILAVAGYKVATGS